jgi:hypothetical protein
LDNLRKGLPYKAVPIKLPTGFGFDKFGLTGYEHILFWHHRMSIGNTLG